jgi:23S rRNA pseudouridine2605 synthase
MSMAAVTVLKALVLAGCGSRRAMAEAIKQERVAVNGGLVTSFKQEISEARDALTLDGISVTIRLAQPIYLMINKPVGVLSTTHDDRGRRTVVDLLPSEYINLNLYPIGRLDLDSCGLLLLTDDGAMTHRLTHPSFEKEKEYIVTIDREMLRDDMAKFEHGIELEDGPTWPTTLRESATERYKYYAVLHEGRKRQLRRMFGVLGYRVTSLKRIRIDSLILGELPEGQMRVLMKEEVAALRASTTSI